MVYGETGSEKVTLISIIVSTYNWPEALSACLESLSAQTDRHFEIVVADDGSTSATTELIKYHISHCPVSVKHVYHEDQGFRLSTIRNKAVAHCEGEYLVFLDGDCVVFPGFVSMHRYLSSELYFVSGNRILLNEALTKNVLTNHISLYQQTYHYFFSQWLTGRINRISPLLRLPLGPLRKFQPHQWKKAKGCNLAMWRKDLLGVNGFDELFEGWGYEDSDLVIRLMHNGINRKEGRYAVPVLHLWHRQNDQSQHDQNFQRLMERLQKKDFIRAEKGLSQYGS
jgi:GT2 family glycosyltransferase